jgi:hypothetical protein
MKDATLALVGVALSGAAVVGLVLYGHNRDTKKREAMAKDDPLISPIGSFPALKVGDVVLVDTAAANLPAPFNGVPTLPCQVDMVLLDPLLVSVRTIAAGVSIPGLPPPPSFSGTIPRSSIKSVVPNPSPPTVFT